MRLPIRLIDGKIPTRAHPTDSGLDLFAASGAVIHPGMTCRIRTGIAVAIPEGFEGQVRPRSSLASRGVYALLGTIDQGYRGEIGVILTNISTERYQVHEGDRVAQLHDLALVGVCDGSPALLRSLCLRYCCHLCQLLGDR